MRIFVLDNYDSFTYNLVHYLEDLDCDVTVSRNDEVEIDSLSHYDALVLSPGPGLPNEAGLLMEVIEKYVSVKPILGVCLGMQAIALYFGEGLENQKQVKHGIQENAVITFHSDLFEGVDRVFKVGLYHSWEVKLKKDSILIPTCFTENNVLMSYQHQTLPIFGVQFHPESILTDFGKKILRNFIKRCSH